MNVDLAIIGGGPAGIAAGIQAHRLGLDVVIFERDELGGQLRGANLVENYPGFPGGITGAELAERMASHLESEGIPVIAQDVAKVTADGGMFTVRGPNPEYRARAVLVATGATPREWDVAVPGSLREKVHFDVWDPGRFAGADVVVVGGGEAAFDRALLLNRFEARVRILVRGGPRAMTLLRERVDRASIPVVAGGIENLADAGDGRVRLVLFGGDELTADHVVLAIGKRPRIEILPAVSLGRTGWPAGISFWETEMPGLYLAGDVVAGDFRQAAVAAGGGLAAAMAIAGYLTRTPEGHRS